MSWFLNNDGEDLYGAMRATLKQTAVGAESLGPAFGLPAFVYAWVYTCTSNGTLTLVGSGQATFEEAGNVTVPVSVVSDAAIPANGGVAVRVNLADSATNAVTCYSPTDYTSVGAGTHNVTVKVAYNDGEDEYHIAYGGGVTYAPDALVRIGPWTADLLLAEATTVTGEITSGEATSSGTDACATSDGTAPTIAGSASAGGSDCGSGVETIGPWTADLLLPASVDATGEIVFPAPGDWQHLASTTDDEWTDFTAQGGETYQYRVTDSLGTVVVSNEITAIASYAPHAAAGTATAPTTSGEATAGGSDSVGSGGTAGVSDTGEVMSGAAAASGAQNAATAGAVAASASGVAAAGGSAVIGGQGTEAETVAGGASAGGSDTAAIADAFAEIVAGLALGAGSDSGFVDVIAEILAGAASAGGSSVSAGAQPTPPFALRVTATDGPTLQVSGDDGPTLKVEHEAGPSLKVEGY